MPETIETGAFVFGAVLVLLALVSGGFKIFGAEISGTAGKLGRVIAFFLGLIFLGVGLWRSSGLSPVEEPPTIAGIWADSTGSIFQVTRTGADTFTFEVRNPRTGLQSEGTGSTKGRRFDSTFRTNIPSMGKGTGLLSADGLELTGTFQDSSLGVYSLTLRKQ
jgi:hypothetical protein